MIHINSIATSLLVGFAVSSEGFLPTISNNHRSSSILAVGVPENNVDDFDAPILADPVLSGKVGKLDHDPIVDDECYLGKNGQFVDCVDFGKYKVHVRSVLSWSLLSRSIDTNNNYAHFSLFRG